MSRRRTVRLLPAAVLLACAFGWGCAEDAEAPPPYVHNRDDYFAFRATHPELLEPNYLPFMVYEVPAHPEGLASRLRGWLGGGKRQGRRLVFCHWQPEDMPLQVWIEPPRGLDAFQDAPSLRSPERYVAAVEQALATWQRDLDGAVRFETAASAADADLEIQLRGERAPEPTADVRVYGAANVGDSCRVQGGDPSFRLDVRYQVRDIRLYVADEHGLLLPDQVEGIARHEIGHALGMRGHSPIPADLMFEEADDRRDREGLGIPDVNSFVSLYKIPSGTVYADPDKPRAAEPPRLLPDGPPRLELAPHVDTRLGFEIQTPEGWPREPSPYGVVAMNGVPWDYEASFQLNVYRFATIEDFVERFGPSYLVDATLLAIHERTVAGRRAREVSVLTDIGMFEQMTLIESGDGRVLVAVAECPSEHREAYEPWFAAVLGSLEVSGASQRPHSRTYGPAGAR
jgi:predicted Zn-dependent protease